MSWRPAVHRLRAPLCAASIVLLAAVASAKDYETTLREYRSYLKRPSLTKRCLGRLRLARTRDDRALSVLTDSYADAEPPRDFVRSYITKTVTDNFGAKKEHLDVFASWREQHAKPTDAFLWYRTLALETRVRGLDAARAIATGDKSVWLRVAALEALNKEGGDATISLIPELLGTLPKDPFERALIVEGLGGTLLAQKWRLKDDDIEEPARALIRMLDDKRTLLRTKHVLARYFGQLLETNDRFLEAGPWLNALLLARKGKEAQTDEYARPKRPTFAGIEATGDRIVYVIDMSDSMLKELKPRILEELRKLPRGPITGDGGGPDDHGKGARRKKKSPFADTKLIDWKKVKTRFDAAREMLKLSLISLPEEKQFAVIFFGDEAGLMDACKGLQPAKPRHVKKVIKELDKIRGGFATADRPWGELRGATNLHGGMYRAFKVMKKGMLGPGEFVNPQGFSEGAETIFLLSDGAPSYQDWAEEDTKDPNDRAGDPETGAKRPDMPTLIFHSPFDSPNVIEADVTRLNLFRKCEIHCVGMGEASEGFLNDMARIGLGQVKMLGD